MGVACSCGSSQGSTPVHTLCSHLPALQLADTQPSPLNKVLRACCCWRADKHAVQGRCSEAKLEKSGFISRAPLDMNLYELGLTHSSERAWVFEQLQHSRISSLPGPLPLSHSQQGQFITWSNFPHCWCYWKTKTLRANHCSSWKSFCGENEMLGPFTLFFILSSPLASAYGTDLISIFILTLFLCDLGSETISKAMCFGGFICLSQCKRREVTEMEVGRGRGGGKARVGRKEGESKTMPVWKGKLTTLAMYRSASIFNMATDIVSQSSIILSHTRGHQDEWKRLELGAGSWGWGGSQQQHKQDGLFFAFEIENYHTKYLR